MLEQTPAQAQRQLILTDQQPSTETATSLARDFSKSLLLQPHIRFSGMFVPVFAGRREGDLGIGDTQFMKEAVDFCSRNGISLLQYLPIFETGGDNSPYNAISAMAYEPSLLTITPEQVPGLDPKRIDLFAGEGVVAPLRSGPIDYEKVKALKSALLKDAYHSFVEEHIKNESPLAQQFADWMEKNTWLPVYTHFRLGMELHNGNPNWTEWTPDFKSLESAKAWAEKPSNAPRAQSDLQYFAYVQWVASRQWGEVRQYASSKGVELKGDIPYGVSRSSADVWGHPQLFNRTWSGGAPPEAAFQPDEFTAKWGQNWGNPPYNWDVHRAEGYAWWKQRIARTLEGAHSVRVDHALGPFRQYVFPWTPDRNGEFSSKSWDEAKQMNGGQTPHFSPNADHPEANARANAKQGKEFFAVMRETAKLYGGGLSAEDLGAVPPYVRDVLRELDIPGYAVPTIEKPWGSSEYVKVETLPGNKVVTPATHDHDPLATMYKGMVDRWHGANGHAAWIEMQSLMRFGLDQNNPPKTYTAEVREAFFKTLFRSPCNAAIFGFPDIVGTDEKFNVPGVTGGEIWRKRLLMPMAAYEADPVYGARIRKFAELSEKAGRKV